MSLRARDITDIGEDLGLERISITSKEGWDHSSMFHVMFGPPAYRQLMEVDPNWELESLKMKLEAAKAAPYGPLTEHPVKGGDMLRPLAGRQEPRSNPGTIPPPRCANELMQLTK